MQDKQEALGQEERQTKALTSDNNQDQNQKNNDPRENSKEQDKISIDDDSTHKLGGSGINRNITNNKTTLLKEYLNDLQVMPDEFYGINRRLYKKPQKDMRSNKNIPEDPPVKTVPEYTFLPNNPEFANHPQAFETVHIPKPNSLEEAIRKEAQSFMFAEDFINVQVYDSREPSPYTKDIQPNSLGLDILPYYIPTSIDDTILVFQSRFQSGNLRRAIQVSEYEYNLVLSYDYDTTSHVQWYYFSVANTRKDVDYRFKIINMMKPGSLYNVGMKPLLYSEKKAKNKKIGWHRDGADICYYGTTLRKKNGAFYSALVFTVRFQYDLDTVYFTHCYPYTYSQLQKYLRTLEADPIKKTKFVRRTLCSSEAGNNCDYLTIGENNNGKEKKAIILTSRVHPGQTMVSYIIQHIIDFLIGNSNLARTLRDNFVFKIIPMLNVDGVIEGNYRCNLSGADLNRQWVDPSRKLHPTIYYAKNLIKKTKQERELAMFCDLHGHSRKKNTFMYGCSGKDIVRKEQVFPMLMKNNCSVFSFKDCCFSVQKDREGAARIALWRELNIINCFTLEVSFCGSDFGKYDYYHFNLGMFKEIAHAFCHSIYDYYEPDQTKYRAALEEVQQTLKSAKYDDKRQGSDGDSDDSDYSDTDNNNNMTNNRESNFNNNSIDNKKNSVQRPQNSSMPQSEGNKIVIKKNKLPLALPVKKKK